MTRKKSLDSIIYGVHPILETLRAGKRIVREVYLARGPALPQDLTRCISDSGIRVIRKSGDELRSLTRSPRHQGVAAKVGPYPYVHFEDIMAKGNHGTGPLLVLDEVQDPVNLGTILRSAGCLGALGVILTRDRASPITAVAEKASAGASAHVPVVRVVNLVRAIGQLKEIGYWIYAADSAGGSSCFSVDLSAKVALVFGSEGKGIRRLVREACDVAISIPMVGMIESLNVSQAAAILLSECLRRKSASPLRTR